MKLLVASHNTYKVIELNLLLNDSPVRCISLDDLNDSEDIEETGKTFIDNAKLKALYYAKKHHMPALADDSGIEVAALGGKPGIYSKRYSNQGDDANNIKLLNALKNVTNRNARFVCAIVVAFPDGKTFKFEGEVKGHISLTLKGNEGFGYDPLFIPNGYQKTMAELGSQIKKEISHRAIAMRKLKEHMNEITHYQ